MIKKLLHNFNSSEFLKNTLKLTGGIIIAQVLPFAFYPFFSRLFSPSEFGIYATISALVPILTIISSGMYEGAILIAKTKQEAANIVGLILCRSFLITFFLIFFSNLICHFLDLPEFNNMLILVPILSFSSVIFNVFNEWFVTHKYFSSLAINKIVNTSAISFGKLFFGIVKYSSNSLILGDLFGKLFSAVSSTIRAYQFDKEYFSKIQFDKFKSLAIEYISFPRYLMADQILNNLSGSIHIFFLSFYFGNKELGFVTMGMSLLTVPVTVISAAIKDVFRQKANVEYQKNGSCRLLYAKLFWPLFIVGLLFFGLLYLILPSGLKFFLGDQWKQTGTYSQFLLPMFFANFVSMSLGGVLIIANKIVVSLVWQLLTILLSSIAFLIGVFIYKNLETTLILFSLSRAFSYTVYSAISYYYSNNFEFI